jgi:serine/threonine protein kinase/beta-lactam-binding protein with PASTA domain
MSTTAESIGRVLAGRYRLESVLGTGASAQVFSAWDVTLRRRVAIKLLHPGLASDPGFRRRFRAEAQAAASLHHPHIMAVFDWGDAEDGPFLVLEHLAGGSLRDLLDVGVRLSVPQALRLGVEACDALAYAHLRGLVHRDVKPANLLFDEDGRLKVADFGLARALAEAAWTEPAGTFLGTALYAAPEQASGRVLDAKADVYALALVLYESVTGHVPFVADTPLATLMARVAARLPDDEALGAMGPILARAASPEPGERPSAEELATSMRNALVDIGEPDPLPLSQLARGADAAVLADEAHRLSRTVLFGTSSDGSSMVVPPSADPDPPPGMAGAAPSASLAPTSPSVATSEDGSHQIPWRKARALHQNSIRRGHRRWPWLLAVAVVVAGLLGAGGTYAAVRLKLFVPSRPVPRIVGLSEARAARELNSKHFVMKVSARRYVVGVPAGSVASERPRAGARLKEGDSVFVVLSLGPPYVGVPSLAGLSGCSAVSAALAKAHLEADCTASTSTTVPEGGVISVSPSSRALWGSKVTVVLSSGLPSVPVPDLSGTDCSAAKALLVSAHLAGKCIDEYSLDVPEGQVISWSPSTSATWGSTVEVDVSLGPPMAQVPSLLGDTVPEAVAALDGVGLVAGSVYGPAGGYVFYSTPHSGQWVREGTSVNLYTQ